MQHILFDEYSKINAIILIQWIEFDKFNAMNAVWLTQCNEFNEINLIRQTRCTLCNSRNAIKWRQCDGSEVWYSMQWMWFENVMQLM